EIIILQTMPLTDVQKPAKAELRRDAARRAFRQVLADVAEGDLSVDIVADPVKGNVAVISIAGPAAGRNDVEERIREHMKAFAFPYVVQWTA
ncbi:MAG: hypothetical protein ACXU85_13955, partial [Xanthobacteraceae bacterium]